MRGPSPGAGQCSWHFVPNSASASASACLGCLRGILKFWPLSLSPPPPCALYSCSYPLPTVSPAHPTVTHRPSRLFFFVINILCLPSIQYCAATKKLFSSIQLEGGKKYKVIELDQRDDGAEIQEYIARTYGQRTVPQIFINGVSSFFFSFFFFLHFLFSSFSHDQPIIVIIAIAIAIFLLSLSLPPVHAPLKSREMITNVTLQTLCLSCNHLLFFFAHFLLEPYQTETKNKQIGIHRWKLGRSRS